MKGLSPGEAACHLRTVQPVLMAPMKKKQKRKIIITYGNYKTNFDDVNRVNK